MTKTTRFKSKILIVSHDKKFFDTYAKLFQSRLLKKAYRSDEHLRYSVYSAKDDTEALKTFSMIHPDLIMIAACTKEGLSLCMKIRSLEESRHTGIIFVESDGPSLVSPVDALENGADDFIDRQKPHEELVARVDAAVRLKIMTDELRQANHRLEILSNTDDLTGLYNMRYFQKFYRDLFQSSLAAGTGFGLCMMDLDRFKTINDSTNHLVGSYIIGEVGKLIRLSQIFGEAACIARYGGDEYIVALPCESESELIEKAECLRSILQEAQFQNDGFHINITSSIGLCFVEPGFSGDINDPVKCADLMLYQSKHRGRNRVSIAHLSQACGFEDICARESGEKTGDKEVAAPRFHTIKVIE